MAGLKKHGGLFKHPCLADAVSTFTNRREKLHSPSGPCEWAKLRRQG